MLGVGGGGGGWLWKAKEAIETPEHNTEDNVFGHTFFYAKYAFPTKKITKSSGKLNK